MEETASLTWTESMARIIGKLTLKDASRGAYEDGTSLIGRERELHKLLTFFRAAVRGDAGTGGVKSSMFIAGPPGVGKVRKERIWIYFIIFWSLCPHSFFVHIRPLVFVPQ